MPFKSPKQRRYMHMKHPKIAKEWEKKYEHGGVISDDDKRKVKKAALKNYSKKKMKY